AGCAAGSCTVASCSSGFSDCDGNPADGCEVNLNADPSNCGACGHVCSLPSATAGCAGGACVVASCNAGFGNCDGNPANGCETPLNTHTNCGACGATCALANATSSCSTGLCALVSCNAGFDNCDGSPANGCETPLNTNANCGACGTACALANAT